MTIAILKTETFQPLGPAIPKPAPAAPKAVEIKPGIWRNPDGKLETRDPTPPQIDIEPDSVSSYGEPDAYGFCEVKPICWDVSRKDGELLNAPLPVVPNALGDWIAHEGGECPIHGPGEWMLRHRDGKEFISNLDPRGYSSQWRHASPTPGAHIVAYRLIP